MASVLEVVGTREQSQSFLKELLSPELNAPTHHPTAVEESNRQVERAHNSSTPVTAIAEAKHDCEPARNENIAAKVGKKLTDLPSTSHREDLQTANTSQSSSSNNWELEQPDTSAKAESSQNRVSNPREDGQNEEHQRKEKTSFWSKPLPSRSSTVTSRSRSISTVTSPVFSPISISSSRSSIAECVDIPIDSRDIYGIGKGIYVGKLKEMPPPGYLENEWLASIRIRLVKDLLPVTKALPRSLSPRESVIEPELCMVGEADPKSQNVIMRPTVWIRCGSRKCRKAVQEAVNDLHYLQTFSCGRVQVRLRAPRPAGDSVKPAPDQCREYLGIHDLTLQLQNDKRKRYVYGRRLRITNGPNGIGNAWTSTIGGLIRVDDVVYALTTAHSIFEALRPTAEDYNDDSDTDSEFSSLNAEDYIASSAQCSGSDIEKGPRPEIEPPEYQDVDLALASYAGESLSTDREGSPTKVSAVTDFALIKWPDSFLLDSFHNIQWPYIFYNNYTSPTKKALALKSFDENPEEGEVVILCHPNELCTGWLLSGDSLFMQRDALFQTRKIQMREPLRPGSSGSWVVRGSRLLGQIIAVYDGEPYAHMMPIGEVVSGIKAAFGSARSPEISLQVRTNSSIHPINGEENAPSPLEDDELLDIPWHEDHQESRSGFKARLKAAGSTVANHFTYIFRRLSKFTKARIRFAVFEPLPPSESFDTLFEKYKRENKARKAATTAVPDFLRRLTEAAIFLLLFFPRLALRGIECCFGRFSSRWLRSLSYAFILLSSVASWSIVAFATAHLAPTLKASEVPIDLLVLSIAGSSLGTLLMTWALRGIPSLFLCLARRKVEREMRLFARSKGYGLETGSQTRTMELQAVHEYLWSKYCTGLDSGNGISRRIHHPKRIDDRADEWILHRYTEPNASINISSDLDREGWMSDRLALNRTIKYENSDLLLSKQAKPESLSLLQRSQ